MLLLGERVELPASSTPFRQPAASWGRACSSGLHICTSMCDRPRSGSPLAWARQSLRALEQQVSPGPQPLGANKGQRPRHYWGKGPSLRPFLRPLADLLVLPAVWWARAMGWATLCQTWASSSASACRSLGEGGLPSSAGKFQWCHCVLRLWSCLCPFPPWWCSTYRCS